MPEFEETKPNLDLHKESHQYQPGKGKSAQENRKESGQEGSSTAQSNMRGRWKRPSRGPAPKKEAESEIETRRPAVVKESVRPEREERSFSPNEDYEIEDYESEEVNEEEEFEQEQRPAPRHAREERSPRSHNTRKPVEQKPFKPTSRKEVFIPKTKQDSERFRRDPSIAKKKPSLWKKILAFFGFGVATKKRSSQPRGQGRGTDASRGPRHSSYNKRPYQQRRHPGQQQRHRSGPSHKQDHKSND